MGIWGEPCMNTRYSDKKNNVDVLLVNPPSPYKYWYKMEHLGLEYLTAVLREKSFRVRIIDAHLLNLDIKDVAKQIIEVNPIIIGFTSCTSESFFNILEIISTLKKRSINSYTCLGGYFATFWFKEILSKYEEIDFIVRSEGEKTFLELVKSLVLKRNWEQISGIAYKKNGKIIVTSPQHLIENLDELPFPARDNMPEVMEKRFPVAISSSRGCTHFCTFCQIQKFYRLSAGSFYRTRSPKSVVDEIETLYNNWGVKTFFFVDDEFIDVTKSSKLRAIEISKELIKRDLNIKFGFQCRVDAVDEDTIKVLKKAGAYIIFLGIESGVQRILNSFKKGVSVSQIKYAIKILNKHEIIINPGFILCDFDTTWDELKSNVSFLENNREAIPLYLHGLSILRGTDLEASLNKDQRLIKKDFYLGTYISDPRVELFMRILSDYERSNIYSKAVLKMHQILFSTGHQKTLGEEIKLRNKVKWAFDRIKTLHLLFLEEMIRYINKGDLKKVPSLFKNLSEKFQQVSKQIEEESNV